MHRRTLATRKRRNFFCFFQIKFLKRKLIFLTVGMNSPLSFRNGPIEIFPTGSPSRDEDVAVYVFDINQPSLPTPFYSVLVPISVFVALSTVFRFIMKVCPQLSAFSPCSSGLHSALLVLSTYYLIRKVSFSPDIILCG